MKYVTSNLVINTSAQSGHIDTQKVFVHVMHLTQQKGLDSTECALLQTILTKWLLEEDQVSLTTRGGQYNFVM